MLLIIFDNTIHTEIQATIVKIDVLAAKAISLILLELCGEEGVLGVGVLAGGVLTGEGVIVQLPALKVYPEFHTPHIVVLPPMQFWQFEAVQPRTVSLTSF